MVLCHVIYKALLLVQCKNKGSYLHRRFGRQDLLPWDALDMGMRKEYLYEEWERAGRLEATVPCFDGCRRCGVCEG